MAKDTKKSDSSKSKAALIGVIVALVVVAIGAIIYFVIAGSNPGGYKVADLGIRTEEGTDKSYLTGTIQNVNDKTCNFTSIDLILSKDGKKVDEAVLIINPIKQNAIYHLDELIFGEYPDYKVEITKIECHE